MSTNPQLLHNLCNLEIPSTIKFSPDRQKVLYSTQLYWGHQKGKHGVSTLWLASTGQANSSRQLTSGTFKDCNPAWHPSGESGERWAIYALRVGGEECQVTPITPVGNARHIGAFAYSPDGREIAFLSADEKTEAQKRREADGEDVQVWGEEWAYTRLKIVDVQSKEIRNLVLERDVRGFCWSPDGSCLGIVSARTPDFEESLVNGLRVSVVDVRLSAVRDLCHCPKEVGDLTWAENRKLYFVAGLPADTLYCGHGVYSIDPEFSTVSYKKVAFGVESDAISLAQVNGEVVVELHHRLEGRVSRLNGEVLYTRKEEIEAFDVASAPESNGLVMAVATSNVNHPVEVYTMAGDGVMVQLSSHGRALEDRAFGSCSFLPFISTDGEVEIDSIYLTPNTSTKQAEDVAPVKPLPTIVLIHGGPHTRHTNAFNNPYFYLAPYLLSLGYGVLIANFRGSSGRGERFASWSNGGAGTYDYTDVVAATQNAIEQGYADKNRLIVAGFSYGGFLSLLCSVRNGSHEHGWEFKASIAGAVISDVDAMALSSDLGSAFMPELHEGRVVWDMTRDDTRNRTASPLWLFRDAMERSKQTGKMVVPPMLLLHGAADQRCHLSQAWGVRRALESYQLPFEFVTYPRQGHVLHEQKFWIDLALRVGRWCDQYIGIDSR